MPGLFSVASARQADFARVDKTWVKILAYTAISICIMQNLFGHIKGIRP